MRCSLQKEPDTNPSATIREAGPNPSRTEGSSHADQPVSKSKSSRAPRSRVRMTYENPVYGFVNRIRTPRQSTGLTTSPQRR